MRKKRKNVISTLLLKKPQQSQKVNIKANVKYLRPNLSEKAKKCHSSKSKFPRPNAFKTKFNLSGFAQGHMVTLPPVNGFSPNLEQSFLLSA